jgi:hypothetical protein
MVSWFDEMLIETTAAATTRTRRRRRMKENVIRCRYAWLPR